MDQPENISKNFSYSWWKVRKHYWKRGIIIFLIQLVENFKRIKWSKPKKIFKEFTFVMLIILFLLIFFYLIVLMMVYIKA